MDMNDYKKYEPIFGSWYIKRKIGSGSFGTVFEITREEWGETFSAALKVISIPSSQDDFDKVMNSDDMTKEEATAYFKGVVEDFNKECVLMSKLKGNTNIVNYEDHAIIPHEDGIGWDILIRMELLTPLTECFKNSDVDESQVVKLGIDICKALELCEKQSIIHRDIKPENIFVSVEGDYKLGDFGVAKVVEGTTGSATTVGTADYAAPEVIIGSGGYKSNVDIYSLGIVMYKFLNSNRLPFLPLPPEAIGYSHRQAAKSRRLAGEELPNPVGATTELSKIIKKACAYNPEDRFSSPVEFLKRLMFYLDGNVYDREEKNQSDELTEKWTAKVSENETERIPNIEVEDLRKTIEKEDTIIKDNYSDKCGTEMKSRYCTKCGREILESEETFCKYCGNPIYGETKKSRDNGTDKVSVWWILLSIVSPLIGIIVGLVKLYQKKTKLGLQYIVTAIFVWAIALIIRVIMDI